MRKIWAEKDLAPVAYHVSEGLIMKLLLAAAVLVFLMVMGAAASIQLEGPAGLAILESLNNSSNTNTSAAPPDLWSWGAVPLGRILRNGTLVEGVNVTDKESVMETPTQAMRGNAIIESGVAGGSSGQGNPGGNQDYYDQKSFGKSDNGVFDATCYKTPTQAQFPTIPTSY